MKKIIIILASIVTLFLVAAILVPVIYEDDIREVIQTTINENVEAKVYFDPAKFGLSLFKSFPNPTASIGDFGILGVGSFEGDTLVSVGSFNITINLFSLFGASYRIKSINLIKPRINVISLKNGEANYQIVPESTETEEASPEEDNTFNLAIDSWSITDGNIRYHDEAMNVDMLIEGLDHSGSGNISMEVYDLITKTDIKKAIISYDGVRYLNGQSLYANATLNINMSEFKFTFMDNELRVNDFPLSFDGFLAMPDDNIEMDLSFSSGSAGIKSLYSLIPGVYTEGYEDIEADGILSFSGFVKGIYNETSMPAYQVQLKAENGRIVYPDLPTPIENINIDMLVDCKDGVIDNTSINISKMHIDLGNNPVDGSFVLRNLRDYSMKADVKSQLNLAELNTIFPIEGLDMKGLFSIDLNADGVYDSIRNIMPSINVKMNLKDGYIKSSEFPKALENMSFNSEVDGSSGKMEDMIITVSDFKMVMEEEELLANLTLKNLVDYQWDLNAKGSIDLQVISEVYPMEGMQYSGNLAADIKTQGKYSDVEAEKYDRFPTSGTLSLSDFVFTSTDLPQGMKISKTKVSLDPKRINIDSFNGTLGKSDIALTGYISNYINYIFGENALLKGNMNLKSNLLDLNEWMSEEEVTEQAEAEQDTATMEVVAIPRDIDFEFNSTINRILYDNLELNKAKGLLTVRDGVLDMSDLSFNLLGGSIVMNGKYDTREPETPQFAYQLNVKNLSIPQTYSSFATVQAFAPMAKLMNGDFSTDFSITGKLKDDMTPVYESLDGKGLIKIADAFMKESKLMSGISGFMKTEANSKQLTLKDVIMKASIENGRAHVAPFNLEIGGQEATISGSIGADGSLDYLVDTEVDAGAVGQQVNQLLASLKGDQLSTAGSKVKLHFNVGGTYDKPKINLAGTTSEGGTTQAVKEQVTEEVKEEVKKQVETKKQEVEQKVEDETKKLLEETEKQIQPQVDSLKKEVTKNLKDEAGKVVSEELDSTANELKESLKGLFKKKKKN